MAQGLTDLGIGKTLWLTRKTVETQQGGQHTTSWAADRPQIPSPHLPSCTGPMRLPKQRAQRKARTCPPKKGRRAVAVGREPAGALVLVLGL
jgi:hypothetical protein